jgi:hypothetical protein
LYINNGHDCSRHFVSKNGTDRNYVAILDKVILGDVRKITGLNAKDVTGKKVEVGIMTGERTSHKRYPS